MRKLTLLLLAFLALVGCRTRKVTTTEQKQIQKERIIKYKDSTQLFAYNSHSSQFSHNSQENYELELETLTDSVGNPRELIYTRIRDGDSETIRVTNGKVKLRAASTHSKSLQQADSALYNNSYTHIKSEAQKHEYTQHKQVSKQVKSSPVRHILWLLLLALLVYICWKYKPFRWKI
nr:MAG TPA: Protein involved in gliding motility 9 Secretion System Type.5A [Caudoviricetes sp.]